MLNHLRALREARGLTLEQLAAAVGTTNQQISHLELGKRQLTVAWLKRLAAVLDCHPWAIVDGEEALEAFRGVEAQQDDSFTSKS